MRNSVASTEGLFRLCLDRCDIECSCMLRISMLARTRGLLNGLFMGSLETARIIAGVISIYLYIIGVTFG